METLLAVTDLHARYGDSHVLRGVTIAIPAGRSLGLLGRNGMGKTTLIRTALGYVRAAEGHVAWQGRAMTGAPPEKMARLGIGYVPEGRGIFPNLSVRENLVMTARAGPDGHRAWTFDRVLATFPRLSERLGHGGQQLSGGEQQMLSIGRALMTNPAPADPRRGDRRPRAARRRRDLGRRSPRSAKPASRRSSSTATRAPCWRTPTMPLCWRRASSLRRARRRSSARMRPR